MGVRYGQVFLKDQNIIHKIIHSISDKSVSEIVEIGCGDGILTEALLPHCNQLHVIEIDQACIDACKARLGEKQQRVTFHHQDVLTLDLNSILSKKVSIVANVPYYLSAPLIKWLVKQRHLLSECILMFQLEVVDKYCAKPASKTYTSLSVYTQFYFEVSKLFHVSRNCFRPIPNVESAVIKILRKDKLPEVDESQFFAMVRSCFWARRKTIKRALLDSPYLSINKQCMQDTHFDIFQDKRGEILTLQEFLNLYACVKPFIKKVHIKN